MYAGDEFYDDDITSGLSDTDRAYQAALDAIEGYCDLCEVEGHTFRTCPRRDDEVEAVEP